MSTAEKTKPKRHWPYTFGYSYEDEDRGITYDFSVNASISWTPPDPSIGYRYHGCLEDHGCWEDFEYEIASLDCINLTGEMTGEPEVLMDVIDSETCSKYCKWFQSRAKRSESIYDKLEELCIAEAEARNEPDYGI